MWETRIWDMRHNGACPDTVIKGVGCSGKGTYFLGYLAGLYENSTEEKVA